MEGFDIEACLESMEILVDTREQPSDRAKKRYQLFECPYQRATLNYGDYTYNFTLPNGSKYFDTSQTVLGDVVIERKMSLEELSGCFCQSRDRFCNEFERAKSHDAKIYLLTENASWEKLMAHHYRTQFNPKAFLASITSFCARYNITPIFCKEDTSGKLIKEILYRELKERLTLGKYDGD